MVEGEFQKRTLPIIGKDSLVPPRTPEAMRDRISTILGEFLEILDEGRKEYVGWEKELEYLIEQNKAKGRSEIVNTLRYSLDTLKALNLKWFGGLETEHPRV